MGNTTNSIVSIFRSCKTIEKQDLVRNVWRKQQAGEWRFCCIWVHSLSALLSVNDST